MFILEPTLFYHRIPADARGTNCPNPVDLVVNSSPWFLAHYAAKLLGIKRQLWNCRNSAGLCNVFLIKDSHDVEKLKKMPLFCELPFKGGIQRVSLRHPQGLTKSPVMVQMILCENGGGKANWCCSLSVIVWRLWPGTGGSQLQLEWWASDEF